MASTKVIMCSGKQRYATMRQARASVRATNLRLGEEMDPYYCRYCGGYHAGHAGLRGKLPPSERREKLLRMRIEERAAEGWE